MNWTRISDHCAPFVTANQPVPIGDFDLANNHRPTLASPSWQIHATGVLPECAAGTLAVLCLWLLVKKQPTFRIVLLGALLGFMPVFYIQCPVIVTAPFAWLSMGWLWWGRRAWSRFTACIF
jgi:hypothetical protein